MITGTAEPPADMRFQLMFFKCPANVPRSTYISEQNVTASTNRPGSRHRLERRKSSGRPGRAIGNPYKPRSRFVLVSGWTGFSLAARQTERKENVPGYFRARDYADEGPRILTIKLRSP
ncbi:hypothetical protein HPB50_015616 [Hyalomma asiaticum]|uniref:Uncharacterized protein n=1 Tax=Hyalomma asiaticum TaxID=266040 RepID=A0ACB7SVZ0_HYAAI|nr:hypothetical protein HPB50_015616 [Hyalomma asiaticum]